MRSLRTAPLLIVSFTMVACSTTHEFRVAAVGDTDAAELSEAAPPGPGAPLGPPGILNPIGTPGAGVPGVGGPVGSPGVNPPLIVASGNVLLGSAGQLATPGGTGSTVGVASGTVSAVLLTTSQTVVQLADGAAVLVDGVGGTLGDAVSIDLAQGQVVGGPDSLIGNSLRGSAAVASSTVGSASRTTSASARVTRTATQTLSANVGKVLAPATGVAAVVQPIIDPPPVSLFNR